MDYRKGEAIVSLRNGIVADGTTKLIVYFKGIVTIDYMNCKGDPVVEAREIKGIPGMERVTIPMSNVSGINWTKLHEGHS